MLVFSQFVQMLQIIRGWLQLTDIPFCYLDGTSKDRLDQVDRFNNSPEIPIFLISLKAGGTGINLTSADYVIHYDPWWNPAVEDQASDRAYRLGQQRPGPSTGWSRAGPWRSPSSSSTVPSAPSPPTSSKARTCP